jgi:GNAT superfamily N-acetyltransferase
MTFHIRMATVADADLVARHRASMFHEIHKLGDDKYNELWAAAREYLAQALPSGEYVGWLVSPADEPARIIAGAGVQIRDILPRPETLGPEAIVLNVYTDPAFRRQGLAELLMSRVIEWAREAGIGRLVLHASVYGRPLYEKLGFIPTNEMRYTLL